MNPMPTIRSCCDYLDSIVLRPRLTVSISSYNKRTGNYSEQKSLSLAAGITLLRGMLMLAGSTAALCATVKLCRAMKKRKKLMGCKKASCPAPKK